jgi:rubrerythrin
MAKEELQTVLDQAITREEDSHQVYAAALSQTEDPAARAMLTDLVREEQRHGALLRDIKLDRIESAEMNPVRDLGISQYLHESGTLKGASLQDVVIFAMKREERAQQFYDTMCGAVADPHLRRLFEMLANEEMRHKRWLERFYDDAFYQED